MPPSDFDAGERLVDLVDHLHQVGALTDPRWRDAFLQVPRHLFVPDPVWAEDGSRDDGWMIPVGRDDPYWWENVYADFALPTQVDDGAPAGEDGRGRYTTSSISQPSLVARMLEALTPVDGARVLEIGTATGYNCALLCARLGAENVVTVEVDPVLAERGRAALHAAGWKPTVVCGDGTQGVPAEAPFDRVLATVAAKRVPHAWVRQTRPGGSIITPWGNDYMATALLRLEVGEDGVATGRPIGDAPFMWLRDQRAHGGRWSDFVDFDAKVRTSRTRVDPHAVVEAGGGAEFAVGTSVPGLCRAWFDAEDDSGEATLWLYDTKGAWASVDYVPEVGEYEVEQAGPRDLWEEVEAAVVWWERAGRPERERFGLTVSRDGQHVWLDRPENGVARPFAVAP
ncbi:methyltransferase domain-containing protein [Nocardiopsis sp. NPDC049922]|uniref:methyltransferase domain-containing protein n=1 Tax=Nocardiopsis sp. NPDC049922 TaxID=3155157 RepID=UPI0033FC9199